MAENNKDKTIEEKKRKSKPLIFRRIGKYFLIIFVVVLQAGLAYWIVEKNYDATYSYVQEFIPEETGKYNLEEIIVNPANTNGQRYLLVKLSLELVDKEDIKDIKENTSKIRNNIINYLSSRSVSELQGAKGKEELRMQLVSIINNALEKRSVRNLYYSKYVMQ